MRVTPVCQKVRGGRPRYQRPLSNRVALHRFEFVVVQKMIDKISILVVIPPREPTPPCHQILKYLQYSPCSRVRCERNGCTQRSGTIKLFSPNLCFLTWCCTRLASGLCRSIRPSQGKIRKDLSRTLGEVSHREPRPAHKTVDYERLNLLDGVNLIVC